MVWNYRIILHDIDPDPKQHWLGLHEVHYDDQGRPNSWTEHLASFATDPELGKADLIGSLELALTTLRDPRFEDVLKISELAKDRS
jgi:hypothetical protein